MASDLVVSSSATTHQPEQRPYDVFLSFRGEDTRDNFVSHLYKALCDHQIKTFIDDDLNRGEDFPPALLTAIQESSISIIVFSENYADSKWCLKELVKIMECKNSSGQIVLPVFYRVDPTDVRNLTGNFGAAFHRLQGRSKGKMDLDKVRSHLMEVADISGWNSQIIRQESKIITEIVGDVLRKLNLISFSYSTNLIGIFHHIEKVESLLCLDKPDTCIVGIWGMGGIGKTTIACEVYNRVYGRFDEYYMLLNVHDELKKQSVNALRDKLLSNIFEKDCQSMGIQSLRPDFIRRQLEQKKVFIVLDDVNDPIHLKELLGGQYYSFGVGSKILVTSRNRQVLKSVIVTDKIYEVEAMTEEDAMTLFSVNAFKQKYPTSSYKELSLSVVNYASGNPLAVVVLGSALFERSKEEWLSALEGLMKEPNNDIRNVLIISYGLLSREEKTIFLDIACLFCGSHRDSIIEYYGKSGLFKIITLRDKSLITISSSNTIEMHDLLKDMGESIAQEEHPHKPEKRERLWIPKDVCTVLAKKTGTAKIKAISLDMSGIEEMHLDGDAFRGMESLKYLKFYDNNSRYNNYREKNKVYFKGNGGVEYLPGGLRYFHWDGFPAKYLPSNFCAENLVELRLNGSEVKKLWRGVQDLRNLKVISLIGCSNLIEIPDLSEAKNLRSIDLSRVFPRVFQHCRNVPRVFVSEALEYLDLSSCSTLRRFPDISSMSTLKYLRLSGTDIEEVPSSVESLSRLDTLIMSDCRRLSTISTNICKLKSLTCLSFIGCVRLESFPEMLEPLEHLLVIQLDGCLNLKTFPGDWYNLKSLEILILSGTSITEVLPMNVGGTSLANLTCCSSRCNSNTKKITYVEEIEEIRPHLPLPGRGIKEPPPPQVQRIPYSTVTSTIKYLFLNRCHSLSMLSFANAIPSFSSLECLDLSENNWESLPGNMDRLSNLISLCVNDCKNLRSIPKLPASLQTLEANDCESLECIHGLIRLGVECNLSNLQLINCFKLEEAARYKILKHSQFRMMIRTEPYECVLPGTELPEWMGKKMGMGSSATIKLPSSHNVEYNWSEFRGFAFSLLFSPDTTTAATEQDSFFQFQCILKQSDHRVISRLESFSSFQFLPVKSEQLFLWSCNLNEFYLKPIDGRGSGELDLGELMGKEVSFEFSGIAADSTTRGRLAVHKCAVHPLFEGETVPLAAMATATTKTNKPIQNPSKLGRRRRLMIRSCSLSLRLSRTRFQRHHSASSKKRIRSFLSLHSSSYKSLKPKRRRT